MKTFDPGDDFDAMAEAIRHYVLATYDEIADTAVYRDLDPHRQLECFVAGVLTGLVGIAFAHVRPEGRDEVMAFIADYMPQARMQAEAMIDQAAALPPRTEGR